MKRLILTCVAFLLFTASAFAQNANVAEARLNCVDGGSTDSYACSLSPAIPAYRTGIHYRFKANTANTGVATINFNGLGAKTIKKLHDQDLADNDIESGSWVDLVYDGTFMQMQSQTANAPTSGPGSGTVTVSGSPSSGDLAKFTSGTDITKATATEVSTIQYCADAGSNDTYACNLSPAIISYMAGTHYRFKANTVNTGTSSINFNSLGALTIKKNHDQDLADGDIEANAIVECVYDGTNCEMTSHLGNAASGASGSITVSGYTMNTSKLLGRTTASSGPIEEIAVGTGLSLSGGVLSATGSSTFASGGYEQYRIFGFTSRANANAFDTIGFSAVAPGFDNSANGDDADGPFRRLDTAALNTTVAGTSWNNGSVVQSRWLPQIITKLKTGSTLTSSRIWVGCFTTGTPSADDPTVHGFGIRYSTNAGDTTWHPWTNDGVGGGTTTDSGVTVSAGTAYVFGLKVVSTSSIEFYISTDNGVTFGPPVATHTTNLPTSNQGMDCYAQVQTLSSAVRQIFIGYQYIRER